MRRLKGNAAHLLGSNVAQAAFGLISTVITARALGPQQFGRLALLSAYCLVLMQLFSFQSTYAVVRTGTQAQQEKGQGAFRGVARVGFIVDICSALAAAAVVWVGLMLGPRVVSLSSADVLAGAILGIGVATNATGSATAVLRLAGRYRVFLWQGVISGLSKVAACALAWYLNGGLLAFAAAWTIAQVLGNALLAVPAILALGARDGAARESPPTVRETLRAFPDFRPMLVSSNLTATMRMIREADIFVLGWVMDATAAGLFRLARLVASTANKAIDPFFHAIYPDLVEAERTGPGRVLRLAGKSSLLVGSATLLAFLVFLAIGEPLLVATMGEEYSAAFAAAALCALSSVVWSFAHPLSPTLMAWGLHRQLFYVTAACSVLYIGLSYVATVHAGILGASMAFAAFQLVWALVAGWFVHAEARHRLQPR